MSLQSSLLVHIASNWNLLFGGLCETLESVIKSAQWSLADSTRWWTLISLWWSHHSFVTRARSNRKYILFLPSCILHHVNSGPQYPRSINLQQLIASLKSSICFWDLRAPPIFSPTETISLKSLKHSHGSWSFLLRAFNKFHNSFLLWTSGFP